MIKTLGKSRFILSTALVAIGVYFIYGGVDSLAGGLSGYAKILIGLFMLGLVAYYLR